MESIKPGTPETATSHMRAVVGKLKKTNSVMTQTREPPILTLLNFTSDRIFITINGGDQ